MDYLEELKKLIESLVKNQNDISKAILKITDNDEKLLHYIDSLELRIKALENANKN